MRIGIDFDNTLVCYDQLFWKLARESGVIPESTPVRKDAVRDYLRATAREPLWTGLQGLAYGSRILEASPFPHVFEALSEFHEKGWQVFIISHKTRTPISGAEGDLHLAARGWLSSVGLAGTPQSPVPANHLFFELTKQAKLQRIAELECDWFIDDLPELLTDPGFPATVGRILFDPHHQSPANATEILRFHDWGNVTSLIERAGPGEKSCHDESGERAGHVSEGRQDE